MGVFLRVILIVNQQSPEKSRKSYANGQKACKNRVFERNAIWIRDALIEAKPAWKLRAQKFSEKQHCAQKQ